MSFPKDTQNQLLGLGVLTMFQSPQRNETMMNVVGDIVSSPSQLSSIAVINKVQAALDLKQVKENALFSLAFVDRLLKSLPQGGFGNWGKYSWTLVALGGFFVALRMFTKALISGNLRSDDWMIWISWVRESRNRNYLPIPVENFADQ